MCKWQRQYKSDRKYLPVWEQTVQCVHNVIYINGDELVERFQIGVVSR